MFEDTFILLNEEILSTRKKSFKRKWNALSRFQKNIILLLFFAVIIVLFFLGLQKKENIISSLFNESNKNKLLENDLKIDQKLALEISQDENPQKKEFLQEEQESDSQNRDVDNVILNPVLMTDKISSLKVREVDDSKNLLKTDQDSKNGVIDSDIIPEYIAFKGPTNDKQQAVVNAFLHSWNGYRDFAWGHDNLKPISMGFHDGFHGLGVTILDSLDTMWIMNLQTEYKEAREWVETSLSFDINKDVNLFEVTIRLLGGLLSIYHLSKDDLYLKKAIDLADRLMGGFESSSGIPYSDVNLATKKGHSPKWSPDSSTSEVSTIQLEFRDLSRITQNDIYETLSFKVSEQLHKLPKTDGLVPIFINANTGMFRVFSTISLGARGDSYYEYLLKQYIQRGKLDNDFLIDDYKEAIDGVIKNLRKETPTEKFVYVGELINGKDFKPKMDHLTCYLPGTLLLGYHYADMPKSHETLAIELLNTCYQTYIKMPTGLAPEITYFNIGSEVSDIYVKNNDAHNLLRPEFVESLYYFYVITGNTTYQKMGWDIFQAFEKFTRVSHGYTSIGNVKSQQQTRPKDFLESFWFAETLKYFYLLFSDDRNEIDLTKFLFNTEAHLIPI